MNHSDHQPRSSRQDLTPERLLWQAICADDPQEVHAAAASGARLSLGDGGHIREATFLGKDAALAAMLSHYGGEMRHHPHYQADIAWASYWQATLNGTPPPIDQFPRGDQHPLACAIDRGVPVVALAISQTTCEESDLAFFMALACQKDAAWFVQAQIERGVISPTKALVAVAAAFNSLDSLQLLLAEGPSDSSIATALDAAAGNEMHAAIEVLAGEMLRRGLRPEANAFWHPPAIELLESCILQHALTKRVGEAASGGELNLPPPQPSL